MLSIISPLIFIPIRFTILNSHASDVPCMQAAPSLIFPLHAPCLQGACSPHQPPSPAPAMRAFAPATMAATSSGCHGTAATAPLSMVPPAVGASSEDDIQAERQAEKEMKSWDWVRSPAQACWWRATSSQISGLWGEWMPWACPWHGYGLKLEPRPKVADERPHCSPCQPPSWPKSMLG